MKTKSKQTAPRRQTQSWRPKRILVPTDFSYPADQALRHALAIARRNKAKVSLIHVVNYPVVPDMVFPATACLVQQGIGASRAGAFDLEAACSGFLYAASVAAGLMDCTKGVNESAGLRVPAAISAMMLEGTRPS
ncbi:MAG: universal stress protein [Gammaproteobacteria bacterium]|nr:universal stress protein [Gammaproteobacteria bacterium]